jgi:ABC-2 type transport system ATP-binding protein
VSLTVRAGEIVGLLGPNGAGKTTTVSMLCGLLAPTQGQVTIDGADMATQAQDLKRRIGFVPQDLALYEDLSARTNLALFGSLYGLSGERLRSAWPAPGAGGPSRSCRRQAVHLQRRHEAAAQHRRGLLHDPDVLLLDEPTVGVDPQSRNAIFDNLEALQRARQGARLHDALHGRGRAALRPHRDHRSRQGRRERHAGRPAPAAARPRTRSRSRWTGSSTRRALRATAACARRRQTEATLAIGADDLSQAAPAVLSWLAAHGHAVRHIASGRASLEDVFPRPDRPAAARLTDPGRPRR